MVVTPQSLKEAAARLEADAPGYLARVRRQAAALSRPATEKERARRAIAATVQTAHVNANVPFASSSFVGRFLKKTIGVLVRFYVLHVTTQVAEFAESSAWMGQSLLEYTESLETEVAELRERVRCLEEAAGAS